MAEKVKAKKNKNKLGFFYNKIKTYDFIPSHGEWPENYSEIGDEANDTNNLNHKLSHFPIFVQISPNRERYVKKTPQIEL